MKDNRISQEEDDEGSLVEIEVAEQEEIEVEESETETENNIPVEKVSNFGKNETPKNLLENEEEDEDKSKEEEEEKPKEKKEENPDKPYSELELKIIDIMNGSEEINNLFNNNNKWDEKKRGLSLLNEFILKPSNREKIIKNFEVFFCYIQDILKNFKESNFILLKAGLECIISLFTMIKLSKNIGNDTFNKKYFNILLTELNEKITESKLKNIFIKLINLLMDIYSPNDIINYLIQIINKSKKVILLKEYAIFFKDYLTSNENNIKFLNAKEIIDFCIKIGNNNNQQLRMLSTDIICLLYNYIGDEYILYIKKNIKESSFKNIEKKLKEINIYIDYNKNDNFNENIISEKNSNEINIESEQMINDSTNGDNNNYYTKMSRKEILNKNRADISKDITPVLLKYINLGKWNEKKEGIEFIHKILNKNNDFILINGLQDLIELIIEKLTDSNKNLVRLIIELLSHLTESLGVQIKSYTKQIMNPLLTNLSDKNNLLRQECVSCINKWISVIQNYETIFMLMIPLLVTDNYDMRNEILNLLINNFSSIKKEKIYTCHFDDLIKSLLFCLQDKSSNIRNKAEKFIELTTKLISREDYINKTNQFKPAITENLNSIINKIYNFKNDTNDENGTTSTYVKRERTTKSVSKCLSPRKLRFKNLDDDEDKLSISRKNIMSKHRVAKSIGKKTEKNSSLKLSLKKAKESVELTDKVESNKKKINTNRANNEKVVNIIKKGKHSVSYSFCNTLESFNKKNKKKRIDTINNSSNYNIKNDNTLINTNSSINNNINNTSNNNNNNNITFRSKKHKKNSNIRITNTSVKKKKRNNQILGNMPNMAMGVNNFYNNNHIKKSKGISHMKRHNKNRDNNKSNISNFKLNMKQEENNEQNTTNLRNRFLSPDVTRLSNRSKQKKSFLYDNPNHNNSNLNMKNNYFYKKMNSNHLKKNESNEKIGSFMNEFYSSKSEYDLKGNLFLDSYRIKKEQKEKRIEEDRRNNYYFEIQNFDQIPKIKEVMKNIFLYDFVEKIFGDNISSIIACINKIKKYIENDTNDGDEHILNIEENLDIILKVIGFKLANNKSSSLIISSFEFISSLLSSYQEQNIFLNEIESNIILNILVDKLVNNSSIIKENANNLIWTITDMIGEERCLLIIMHLIEYKNIKTKIESINIIIKLYKELLEKDKFIFDNWKLKIIKNVVNLYFEGDYNNKNKLIFIIKDLYSCFKNEIWKHCKNISSKNKDDLLKRIREDESCDKSYFDNDYKTYTAKITTKNSSKNINKINDDDKSQIGKDKKAVSKKNEEKSKKKNSILTKLNSNIIYKKNKKFFGKKKIKLDNEDISLNHLRQSSNIIESKNLINLNTKESNADDKSVKNIRLKRINKNFNLNPHNNVNSITTRSNSAKKNIILKHINTSKNIHENQKYGNLDNQKNKLLFSNNTEGNNYEQKVDKNNLSQSTVIINNNYNFIKIKNNEDQNNKKERIIIKKSSHKNVISNPNNDNNEESNSNINEEKSIEESSNNKTSIIDSNTKKKIVVNCNKKEKFNEIKKILESLCSGDKTEMTELILKIHNILYTNYKKNESIIVNHCDFIFNKLIQAINNLLNEKKIYTNYIKYISNVLCKICKLGELLSKTSLDTQNNLIILTIKTASLLNDEDNENLYYNDSNEENAVIIKCFNSIMLQIIECGDVNNSINLLMNYEKKYRKTSEEIVSYVAKCLIVLIKNIKITYQRIDIGIIVENIYNLLEEMEINDNIVINNKTDQIIIITIKNILSQIIIYRGEKEVVEYIKNKHNTKKNDKKHFFESDNKDKIKNWLLLYINRLVNRNKNYERNENMEDYKRYRNNEYDDY